MGTMYSMCDNECSGGDSRQDNVDGAVASIEIGEIESVIYTCTNVTRAPVVPTPVVD